MASGGEGVSSSHGAETADLWPRQVSTQGWVEVWMILNKDTLSLGFVLWVVGSAWAPDISRGVLLTPSLSPLKQGPRIL